MPLLFLLMQISCQLAFSILSLYLTLLHDIHTNTAPPKIINLFLQTSSIHAYNTRSSSKNNTCIKTFN